MPTARGLGVLALATMAYLAGRVVGTYELYVVALFLAVLVVLSGLMVLLTGRRLSVNRTVYPAAPVAGDEASLTLGLQNSSFLPTAAVRVTEPLGRVTGEELALDLSPLGPKASRTIRERVPGLRRGAYSLPASRLTIVDPLGLFVGNRRVGDELELMVLPRLAVLTSCVFFGGRGLGQNPQSKSSRAHSALDLRGVRPHQPGEPLSRIDWKTTAKTGVLMLRETEEPSRTDVVILLDGSAEGEVGEPPETSFEAAVAAAGSIADYVLREGFAVRLLLNGDDRGVVSEGLDSRDRGRWELLEVLAAAKAESRISLAEAVRRRENCVVPGLALVAVSSSFERSLLLLLTEMREKGVPVYLVHVDALSFAGPAVPDVLETERRRFLLGLSSAGIPSVTLRRGDDLVQALSFGPGQAWGGSSEAHRGDTNAAGPAEPAAAAGGRPG